MSGTGGKGTGVGAMGRQNGSEDEAEGTKIKSGKDEKGSPAHPLTTGLVNSISF
jgi:hypothetical protein